jgi:hypothetical protein
MRLDWKWIAIGVVIMLALSVLASFIVRALIGPELAAVTDISDVRELPISGRDAAIAGVLNFLAFLIGGFIVGLRSIGRTILEPGISAALATIVVLLLAGSLSPLTVLAAGLVPFLEGMFGGWLGERGHKTRAVH